METVAKDIFDNVLEPGDFFLYSPGSQKQNKMRLGIFIGVDRIAPKRLDEHASYKVKIKLIDELPFLETMASLDIHTFSQRAAFFSHPEFSLNNKLIQKAIRTRDELIDQGLIPRK